MERQEDEEIYQYEIENRIRNLCWTVSGDYSLNLKLDTVSYKKSPYISLYDAVKQGAFSKYFDRNAFGLYLVKKLYYGADEKPLTSLAQMAVDSAVYRKAAQERPGILEIRRKAFEDTMEHDFTRLAASYIGQVKLSVMQEAVRGSVSMQSRMRKAADMLAELEDTRDTMAVIRAVDALYNLLGGLHFGLKYGPLVPVLAVSTGAMKAFDW